ncbi:TetR/AcrR family transcriptional regulator [Streptomyces sp. NPDC005122]
MTLPEAKGGATGDLRRKIVLAAVDVLDEEGLNALSIRAVASRAGVFPPTIFRIFGDKEGLLEALGEHGLQTYLQAHNRLPKSNDPVVYLRRSWDLFVAYALKYPDYYILAFGRPQSDRLSPAAQQALSGLKRLITRVAAAGRLRMSIERATAIVHAASVGVILPYISGPPDFQNAETGEVLREIVLAAITTPPTTKPMTTAPDTTPAGSAMALRVALADEDKYPLSPGERLLFLELLNRLADIRTDTG